MHSGSSATDEKMVHSIIIARWPDRFSKTWRRKVANIQKDSLARVELLSRKLSITVLIFGCNARHGAVCYNENDQENVIEEHSGAPSHIRIRMRGNERKMEQVTRTCPRLVLDLAISYFLKVMCDTLP